MSGDVQVRFCERPGVRFPRATHPVFGFERQDDAGRVKEVLEKRLARYGLRLNHDKTRLLDFWKPRRSQGSGKGPGTFDFLGFTWYWRRARNERWVVTCKTRRARLSRIIRSVYGWCRCHRHLPIGEQHAALVRRVRGHYNYFGVSGNVHSLQAVAHAVKRMWFKWLRRRSQRARLTWQRFEDLLRAHPLPVPRVVADVWSRR
jgi:RNA-directed DNA polymerase